jgi:biopolymer transport protein ExbD
MFMSKMYKEKFVRSMSFVENAMNFYHRGKSTVMAQMEIQAADTKKTKRRPHTNIRIDMTPMVDLGFLLITFFIFTTTMSESKAMKLFMPTDKGITKLGESKALTVLLAKDNKLYTYEGKFEDAVKQNRIIAITYDESNGIGNIIRQKQKQLQQTDKKEGRNGLVFLIKPTAQSTYKNVVDALDETLINDVKKYMVIDASAEEKVQLQKMDQ